MDEVGRESKFRMPPDPSIIEVRADADVSRATVEAALHNLDKCANGKRQGDELGQDFYVTFAQTAEHPRIPQLQAADALKSLRLRRGRWRNVFESKPFDGDSKLFISPAKNPTQKKLEFHTKLLRGAFDKVCDESITSHLWLNRRDGLVEYKRTPIARVEVFLDAPSKVWFSAGERVGIPEEDVRREFLDAARPRSERVQWRL